MSEPEHETTLEPFGVGGILDRPPPRHLCDRLHPVSRDPGFPVGLSADIRRRCVPDRSRGGARLSPAAALSWQNRRPDPPRPGGWHSGFLLFQYFLFFATGPAVGRSAEGRSA